MTEVEFVVVGAGIAGLACASQLARRGADVLLLEAAERAGGPVDTLCRDGFLIERGPSTVRASPALDRVAGLAGAPLATGRRRAPMLVSDGRLVRLPPSPLEILSGSVIPPAGLLDLLREPLRPRAAGPQSVASALRARLGPRLADRFADLMTLGIYGAPAGEVGFESAFPELAAELAELGSFTRVLGRRLLTGSAPRAGLISTPGGLLALIEGLTTALGPRLETGVRVEEIRRRDASFELRARGDRGERKLRSRQLVLTTPPAGTPALPDVPGADRLLAGYRTKPQALASFAARSPGPEGALDSFGFLVPTREGLPLLGCLIPSAVFPDRAPTGAHLLTAFLAPELQRASPAHISAALAPLLERLLDLPAPPELLDVARHPAGIPLYDRRHATRTRALRRRLGAAGGPDLAGWAYSGVALGAAAASGLAAADRLLPGDD